MAANVFNLEFEKPIIELERQIAGLKKMASDRRLDVEGEIVPLEAKLADLRREIYRNLSPMQRVQVARHPRRLFRDDPAIVAGWARLEGRSVVVIGQQKGRDTKENLRRNFGMPHPEGYRKALRLMHQAERFHVPVITLIDTPGAYPGLGAEERGQAEAIAHNLEEMGGLRTPIIAAVIGEGGSGGALALGVADRLLMMENAVYSVISPEGCAAILWNDATQKERAAHALKLTAEDLHRLEIVDEIVPEPPGGAHSVPEAAATALAEALARHVDALAGLSPEQLVRQRAEKYRRIGRFVEE
jgi:acetyl-CoA carboxylase carboxyl transferase subunit alpha